MSTPALASRNTVKWPKYSEEEDHLIIFLKEAKKLTWREIIECFKKHFNRGGPTIQTRYSQKLNKRDRNQDPPRLRLPAKYAAEAGIDWGTAQRDTPRSAETSAEVHEAQVVNHQFHHKALVQPRLPLDVDSSLDVSSANESARPRRRPRRSVQTSNAADPLDDESPMAQTLNWKAPFQSPEQSVEPSVGPEDVIPIDTPMEMGWQQEAADARLAILTSQSRQPVTSGGYLPYLTSAQQWDQRSGRSWQCTVIHVDFDYDEIEVVEQSPHGSQRRLQKLMKAQTEPQLLHTRDKDSIDAFLQDARQGMLRATPHIDRLGAVRQNRKLSTNLKASTSSLVRQRELGLQSRRGWKAASRPLSYQMRNNVYDTLGPAYYFTGASSDVHTVAWSPDGQCFVAGAVCVTDPDSMQYNRPNNLLFGDITNKVIHELGEHKIDRKRTETGPNSTYAMYVSQDPKLYTTVSAVAFSPNGDYMFSAGYDKHAIVWGTRQNGSQPELIKALKHKAKVDLLAVGCHGLVATAAKKWTTNAVKVMNLEDPENIVRWSYTSAKARERPDMNILPTSLKFEPNHGRMLLAGFGANMREDRLDTSGDICLWDVVTQTQLHVHGTSRNVFDVAFNSCQRTAPLFAVGCVASQNVNRGTRSLVRFHDGRGEGKYSALMELECPALDMNDILFCPYDENIVAAGCTSGSTYIWDIRRPASWLYKLTHGKSLMPLHEDLDREISDTGVRFVSWGNNATRLYTGSSDGVVKVWDVARSSEDVFIKDIMTVDSGIMSGAFSPDKSRLLIGEVNGSINVLEVGREDCSAKDTAKLKYRHYEESDEPDSQPVVHTDADSGRAIASDLLASGEMVIANFGGLPICQAVQGPSYAGPFDHSVEAPFLREQALDFQLSLVTDPGPQCDISNCQGSGFTKVTSEEAGDSGKSGDRIPDALRQQWKAIVSDLTVIPGKTKCTQCGRPARPSDSTSGAREAESLLCERCSFACFRCGAPISIAPDTEILACGSCKRVWEIGALGYDCVQESNSKVNFSDIPQLTFTMEKGALTKRLSGNDACTTFGDEMNALTDYYHSLALDRPLSPPL
ncbi:WD40 repeat-like protein [Lindgomyces ingoldianus]|uniref:WD40 repeat-like protein n=1 Tax=Lindgomyces ingoldianus TaxID=673940 RepID=A0ACB6QWY7_9PLEO|nr:WD40 repeat-like protein [Lindgomyces ingoldianus]KAF2471390.1 WD40 repeat-like protein [Lindgomyces ingoldianus]